MSAKHYFPSSAANTLVPRYLKALVAANPHLTLDVANRVVSDSQEAAHVAIIGGGGSGHEPAWSGYVGTGLLSAAACGDIFASPSTKQIMAAIRAVPSHEGTILLVTNYTGDRLHFGLAAERAKAEGLCGNIVVLPVADDVSLGRTLSARLGRRGLAGHVIIMKILGAAAAEASTFNRCLEIGHAVNAQVVTIASALDHCHVPGREGHEPIPDDTCVVGSGIHNEPGVEHLSPFPAVEELIAHCLALLCDSSDPERGFVNFGKADRVVLLVNNTGGLSRLELGALVDEVLTQLGSNWGIFPVRVLAGTFETSLNAPGFSISLCNVSAAARQANATDVELLRLLDQPTSAAAWPNPREAISVRMSSPHTNGSDKVLPPQKTNGHAPAINAGKGAMAGDILIDPIVLDRAVRTACETAIAAEPQLTKWDLIMGDGDCGEGIKSVCEMILHDLDSASSHKTGSVLELISNLLGAVEDMGGTLGAIFGILLAALQSSLRKSKDATIEVSESKRIAAALSEAVAALKGHTSAREGDRTVMDVLLPFSDAFAKNANFGAAVNVAKAKAEATRFLRPRFGRATYVGAAQGQEVPDPGAWALYEMLNGLAVGLGVKVG